MFSTTRDLSLFFMLLSECSQLNSTTNVLFKTEQAINLLNNTVAKEVIQNKPLKINSL